MTQPWNDPRGLTADTRRASALMAHHLQNNADGVMAVLDEAEAEGRSSGLLLALLDLAVFFSPVLRDTDAAVDLLRCGAVRLAGMEEQ